MSLVKGQSAHLFDVGTLQSKGPKEKNSWWQNSKGRVRLLSVYISTLRPPYHNFVVEGNSVELSNKASMPGPLGHGYKMPMAVLVLALGLKEEGIPVPSGFASVLGPQTFKDGISNTYTLYAVSCN